MVFPLLLIYSFLGTCFWTVPAALVFQAAPAPQLGWRKHIVTSWHAHRQVVVAKDGTLPDLTMTRGAYPFWSASPRRRLIMGNSRFTFALGAFRSGPLRTLVSLHISCNIPTLTLAPEMKSLRNWNVKLQNGTWLIPWLYSTFCWRTTTGSSFTNMFMSYWRGRFSACRDQSRLLICCMCRQRCVTLMKIFHHPRSWIQNPQKQTFQTLDGRCGGSSAVYWLLQKLHFRTCGLWRMFVIAPSYFGSHVAACTTAPTMPDSGYNKITTASVSPLDYACPTELRSMVFRIKWDAHWYSKWSQSLRSLSFFSSLAAGLASIHRIKALLALPRSPLSWMLSDSSNCFWPSSQMSTKLLPHWLQLVSWIPWTNPSPTACISVPRPGLLSRFTVPAVCFVSLFASAPDAFVSYLGSELQWEPRCMASAVWCSFGRSGVQESYMLSWTSQLFCQGTLHTLFHDQSSLFDSRQAPYFACTHGPTSLGCSALKGCTANMEYTPQRPELPAPGDCRPPLPRRRRPVGLVPMPTVTAVSTTQDAATDTPEDGERAGRTLRLRAPLARTVQAAASTRAPLPRKPKRSRTAKVKLNSLPNLPVLSVTPLHSISTEIIPLYSRYGDPAIELPMDATLKQAHHPRARLLELDVGVSRLRLIDISEVPLCSVHRAPVPTDAGACTSTRSPASFGMKPKAKACDQPRTKDVPKEDSLSNGAVGGLSGAAGSRGIPSTSKSRFAKIRGSLRECLRRRPEVGDQLTNASQPFKKGPSVRPRAFKRRHDGVPILASGTPVEHTEVTFEPIPCDPEPTEAAEQVGELGDKDYDAIYKARLARILADERKCSLLMWQRAQFLQRAEMAKMKANGSKAAHTGTSPSVSPTAGTHTEAAGLTSEPIHECARADGAYMVHCSCIQMACTKVQLRCVTFIHSPRPLRHWLDVLQHNALVLCRYSVPDVLYDIFTMRNEVPDSQTYMSFSSSSAAQTHILRLCHTQLAAGGGAETTMHKTCTFLEKMQHRSCFPQCLVLTSCVAPDSIWQLLSTVPYIESSRYALCFSTLYPHMSYSACLCDVHGQTMPMLGCAAAFSLILPVHISDRLVHDRRRHTCTLSEHRCHLWRLWRFKRPQHRRPLRHRRSGLALFSAILRCKFGLRYGNLSLFQLAVPPNIVTTWNTRPTQSTPPIHTGRRGPKSEASRHIRHAHYGGSVCSLFRLLCIAHLVTLPASGARVSTGVATVEGATTRCEKLGSPALAKRSDATDMHAPPFTRARKRAYRRAVGRAQRHGHTMYRGRRLTFQQLTGHAVHPSRQSQRGLTRTPNPESQIRLLCWNVGGLSNSVLDELYCWLDLPVNREYKIVLLQETHWTFSSEWTAGRWSLLHSGSTKHKGGGVLTLIDKDLCPSVALRTRELLPGRLQHTRVPMDSGISIDIFNVYQYAWDARAPPVEQLNRRKALLDLLENAVREIPQRNLCLCAGDLNVQLVPMPGLVGHSTSLTTDRSQSARDPNVIRDLLAELNLVALNTWTGSRRQAYTFLHHTSHTQIDYVLMRRYQASERHRACRPLPNFPVAAWRLGGQHRPLTMPLDIQYQQWRSRPQRSTCKCDVQALIKASQTRTPAFTTMVENINQDLLRLEGLDVPRVNEILIKHSCSAFASRHIRPDPPHLNPQVQGVVRQRWQHLREAMRPRVATIRGVFHAWRHFIRFRALRKLAHRCSRLARQQKQDELLAQAEQYAQRHNMHQLYRIIRLMAPRQRYKKVQLYGRDGHMLSRDQEVEEFKQHLDKVYRGDDFQDIVKTAECPDPFSADELQSAFSHIPVYKATPPHMAPGPVWRAAAKGLALLVAREFPKLCAHPLPRVPQYWRDGWLTLFCKPGKPGRRPEDYRPICLQDPVGKAVLSLLAARIKPVVQA